MSELSPETRAWIDVAGRGDGPRDEDRTRIRQRLALQLGAAALATTTVTVGAVSAHAASSLPASVVLGAGKTSMGLFGKIAIAAALVGVVSTAAVVAVRTNLDNSKVAVNRSLRVASAALLERETPKAMAKEAAPAVEQLVTTVPATAESDAIAKKPARGKHVAPRDAANPAESSIAAELVLLRQAHLALRAGRSAEALKHTQEHGARFPAGALHEEREAVEMLALCAQGAVPAPKLAAFLKNAPESPLKARVRSACEGP